MIRRPWSTLFIDFLFNLVVLFALLINPVPHAEASKPRAAYTLSLQWDQSEAQLDLDLYIRLPDARVVWFRSREEGAVFLDRDHLGRPSQGFIRREDVQLQLPVLSGTYAVSVHTYNGMEQVPMALELVDATGKTIWGANLQSPPFRNELPIALFTFLDGKLVAVAPSTLFIIPLRGRYAN